MNDLLIGKSLQNKSERFLYRSQMASSLREYNSLGLMPFFFSLNEGYFRAGDTLRQNDWFASASLNKYTRKDENIVIIAVLIIP